MARGAAAIRALPPGSFAHPEEALRQLGDCLRRAIGGSSGPFYATALLRAARRLGPTPGVADWAEAFSQAVQAIGDLGGARPGDRTMLDALHPAAEAFHAALERGEPAATAWGAAVRAAEAGAEATATMRPRLGRASYLGTAPSARRMPAPRRR
ncbi:DAK2 domain-containing protein [Pseudoroseomonas wenyumeiae]